MKRVYLSGPISGLTYDQGVTWRKHVSRMLSSCGIRGVDPMRSHEFLRSMGVIEDKHAQEGHPLSYLVSDEFIGTRDAHDTMNSDVCFVNLLGATRISIGTVLEIGMAHAARVPIVLVMEKGNIHEHAMIRNYATLRFDDLEQAIRATVALLAP